MLPFTVLISVYAPEKPEHLQTALESIWNQQTLRPSEIVLVKDGPLTQELDEVIDRFKSGAPAKIISLDHNYGLGYALAYGLGYCTHELVARMDSDDIAFPDRFERQIRLMQDNPGIDISGTSIAEFHNNTDEVCSYRRLPSRFSDIQSFARKRNPLNHMTVLFRKTAVMEAGNYRPFYGYEDYYLWIRMILNGSRIENLPEELVYARVGNDMYARRHGIRYFSQELRLQKELVRMDFINHWEYFRNIVLRAFPRLFPVWGLKLVYRYLRKV